MANNWFTILSLALPSFIFFSGITSDESANFSLKKRFPGRRKASLRKKWRPFS